MSVDSMWAAGLVPEQDVILTSGTTVPTQIYPATGNRLFLWFPSEFGFVDTSVSTARRLAGAGIEVWQADLLGAHVLPALPSSIDRVPVTDIAGLIDHAGKTGKQVFLLADGRGAVLALRGAHYWRQATAPGTQAVLAGAVLLSPSLYVVTPEPGKLATYLPIVSQTQIRIHVLQPTLSPWYWWLDRLEAELEKGGSAVSTQTLPGVRDRFFFRPDSTPAEDRLGDNLAQLLQKALAVISGLTDLKGELR